MIFEDFKYRHFLLTSYMISHEKQKCIELIGESLYNEFLKLRKKIDKSYNKPFVVILDLLNKSIVNIFTPSGKSFLIYGDSINTQYLSTFKVSDKFAYNQNVLMMWSIENRVEGVYMVDGVWFLIHYKTPSGKNRVILNINSFSNFTTFKARDYKIYKLLNKSNG